jgi:Holliday junction resolvase
MTSRTERQLLDDIEEQTGLVGIRLKDSRGTRKDHEPGDLWVGRPHAIKEASKLYIIEEKYSNAESTEYIGINQGQAWAMVRFAEAIGAMPVYALRWSTREQDVDATHYLTEAYDVLKEDVKTNYIKPETAKKWKATAGFFD